jgi:lipopolysaccharide export system permease protein
MWRFDTDGNPEVEAETFETVTLDSNLTLDEIRASFGSPSTIPIWALPQHIARLERAGFAAWQHRVWLQMELANPLFYAAMVLVAAAFTLRHTRFGRTGPMILGALLMAFSLYFVRNFAQILGENGQIPVYLAVWAPPVATLLLPLGLLLHLEDG